MQVLILHARLLTITCLHIKAAVGEQTLVAQLFSVIFRPIFLGFSLIVTRKFVITYLFSLIVVFPWNKYCMVLKDAILTKLRKCLLHKYAFALYVLICLGRFELKRLHFRPQLNYKVNMNNGCKWWWQVRYADYAVADFYNTFPTSLSTPIYKFLTFL